jgi:hypothetical protein
LAFFVEFLYKVRGVGFTIDAQVFFGGDGSAAAEAVEKH